MKKQSTQTERELTRAELRHQLEKAVLKANRMQDLVQKTQEANTDLEAEVERLTEELRASNKQLADTTARNKTIRVKNTELSAKVQDLETKLATEQMHYKAECERRNGNVRTIHELERIISSERKDAKQLRTEIEQNNALHDANVEHIYSRNLWQRVFNTKV